MPRNTFMSCASNVKLHINPVNSVPLEEVLQELLVWIKVRNETAGMSLSFRTEQLYKLLQLLGNRALWIFIFGRFIPIFPLSLSLPLSIHPHWLFSPALVHLRELLEMPLRTMWDNHRKKSLAKCIQMLWELLLHNIPRLQRHRCMV